MEAPGELATFGGRVSSGWGGARVNQSCLHKLPLTQVRMQSWDPAGVGAGKCVLYEVLTIPKGSGLLTSGANAELRDQDVKWWPDP